MKAIENTEAELEISKLSSGLASSLKISGGLISVVSPLFTRDSKYVFTARGNQVQLWSIVTGECVRILEGHTNLVTSFALNPTNALQLYSSSLDGHILVWDFQEGVILKTYVIKFPIMRLMFCASKPDLIFYVTQHAPKFSPNGHVYRVCHQLIKPPADIDPKQVYTLLFKQYAEKFDVAVDPKGQHVCAVFGSTLLVYSFKHARTFNYQGLRDIACVSVNPVESCIATGDCLGQVTLWYYLDGNGDFRDVPKQQSEHWHANGVSCMTFHPDGSFLLSGGEEGVLVIWQLATNNKRFLPRIGGKLLSIRMTEDAALYAIASQDNAIRIFDSITLEAVRVLSGIMQAAKVPLCKPYPCRIVVDPSTKLVALNGMPGTLQFFNILQDKFEFDHAVVPHNFVQRTYDRLVAPTTIDRVAFSENGEWMVTVEHRNDTYTQPELRLKFWQSTHETRVGVPRYTLNTVVDPPCKGSVNSIDIHPSSSLVLSCGHRSFKIWAYQEADGHEQAYWYCQAECSFQRLGCTSGKFSRDGSLIAAAFGAFVTLWSPSTGELLHVISLPSPSEDIKFVGFLGASPFLLVASFDFIYIWNLVSLSLVWSVQVYAKRLVVDRFGTSRFAFVTLANEPGVKSSSIVVYSPQSPKPIAIIPSQSVLALAFVPSLTNAPKGDLVYFDERLAFNVAKIDEESSSIAQPKPNATPLESSSVTQQQAAFARVFGQPAPTDAKPKSGRKQPALNASPLSALFNAPTHILPAPSTLALKFFEHVLPVNTHESSRTSAPPSPTSSSQATNSVRLDLLEENQSSDSDDDRPMDITVDKKTTTVVKPKSLLPAKKRLDDMSFLQEYFTRGLVLSPTPAANSGPSSQTPTDVPHETTQINDHHSILPKKTPSKRKQDNEKDDASTLQTLPDQATPHRAPKTPKHPSTQQNDSQGVLHQLEESTIQIDAQHRSKTPKASKKPEEEVEPTPSKATKASKKQEEVAITSSKTPKAPKIQEEEGGPPQSSQESVQIGRARRTKQNDDIVETENASEALRTRKSHGVDSSQESTTEPSSKRPKSGKTIIASSQETEDTIQASQESVISRSRRGKTASTEIASSQEVHITQTRSHDLEGQSSQQSHIESSQANEEESQEPMSQDSVVSSLRSRRSGKSEEGKTPKKKSK